MLTAQISSTRSALLVLALERRSADGSLAATAEHPDLDGENAIDGADDFLQANQPVVVRGL